MLTATYMVVSRDVTPLLPIIQIAELKVLLQVKNLLANENTFHKTAWSHIIKPDPKFVARNPPGMNLVAPRCHLAHLVLHHFLALFSLDIKCVRRSCIN